MRVDVRAASKYTPWLMGRWAFAVLVCSEMLDAVGVEECSESSCILHTLGPSIRVPLLTPPLLLASQRVFESVRLKQSSCPPLAVLSVAVKELKF